MPLAFIGKIAGAFALKLLGAAVTERVLAAVFFWCFRKLALSTRNGLDDKLYEEVKSAYYSVEVQPIASEDNNVAGS